MKPSLLPSFGVRHDAPICRTTLILAANQVWREAGIDNVRPHDLRRTMRSGLGALGIRAEIAELAVGHRLPPLLRTYDRSNHMLEQRHAVDAWANRVAACVAGKSTEVIEIQRSA